MCTVKVTVFLYSFAFCPTKLIAINSFPGICKLCRSDHLAAIRIDQPSNVLFVEETGEPSAAADAEDVSEAVISPEPHASGETRRLPEVCFTIVTILNY